MGSHHMDAFHEASHLKSNDSYFVDDDMSYIPSTEVKLNSEKKSWWSNVSNMKVAHKYQSQVK